MWQRTEFGARVFLAFTRPVAWGWGIALVAYVLSHWLPWSGPTLLDLEVYLAGSQRLVDHAGLYNHVPGALPYTYPPISGFLFVPLLWPAPGLRGLVLIIITSACLLRTLYVCLRSVSAHRHARTAITIGLLALACCVFPIWSTYTFGQVNMILLWMVCEDVLGRRSQRWSGIGIGLAAAIKLTPLFFVAVLLFTPMRAVAVRGAAAFLSLTALAWVATPADSTLYWTQLIKDPSRVGGVEYVHNQSLNGELWRLLGAGGHPVVWFMLSAAVGVVCILAVRKAMTSELTIAAVAIPALGMLLTSPISWSHHWVWALPMLTALWVGVGRRHPYRIALLVLAFVTFTLVYLSWLPNTNHAEFHYSPLQHLIASTYPLWALAVLAAVWAKPRDMLGRQDSRGAEVVPA